MSSVTKLVGPCLHIADTVFSYLSYHFVEKKQEISYNRPYMEKMINELKEKQNIRNHLSSLRALIKNPKQLSAVKSMVEKEDALWLSFLKNEDAKTRKNAALLLGDLAYQGALDALWEAYQTEDTLFVRGAYLTALYNLDVSGKLEALHERMNVLMSQDVLPENRKHLEEELRAIRKILIRYEGISHHRFRMGEKKQEMILVTNRIHREVVRRALRDESAKLHPLGVKVCTKEVAKLFSIRCFREMLFEIKTKSLLPAEPKEAAQLLMEGNMLALLQELHAGEGAFYFRIECKNSMELEERSQFTKKLAANLERLSEGRLVNSAGDYEVELRLVGNKEGRLYPVLKCYTLKDPRFAYRQNTIAASILPSTAALIMELAKPYLKKDAQIMDPFCGVGTMLIERNAAVPAKEVYATDIFGEAIEKGRENARLAKMDIHFIHRDFFDFKHDYLFDEMITNMPTRGKKTREEMDWFYGRFFAKALELLKEEAVIVLYTNEIGFVKKQIRLHKELSLLQETLMQEKNEYYVLIIGVKR